MKIILALFLCLFCGFSALAQGETENAEAEISVKEIALARDDGNGKPGEAAEKFDVSDRRIHCIIELSAEESVAVKMIFIAAKADGLKPETKIVTVGYTTKENENGVTFNASPNGIWAAGSYRVDIYINNIISKSRTFEIEKSAADVKKEKPVAPKTFAPRKKNNKPRKN